MNVFEGEVKGGGARVAIVASRFNEVVTRSLADEAPACLLEHGVAEDDIDLVWVPGAWELPPAVARVLQQARHDAVIALGAVIRGGTPHFEYVAGEATRGLGVLAREAAVPVAFGLLTTDNLEQALARAGSGPENKGWDAALTAMKMMDLLRKLS
jgi:6,7-dimethyl-8-ribityllumazine synthase